MQAAMATRPEGVIAVGKSQVMALAAAKQKNRRRRFFCAALITNKVK
jgi:hypothetical protein